MWLLQIFLDLLLIFVGRSDDDFNFGRVLLLLLIALAILGVVLLMVLP